MILHDSLQNAMNLTTKKEQQSCRKIIQNIKEICTHQDLSNDTTFNQIKSRVPVPIKQR